MRAASLMLAGSVLTQYGPVLANMCHAAYRLLHFPMLEVTTDYSIACLHQLVHYNTWLGFAVFPRQQHC